MFRVWGLGLYGLRGLLGLGWSVLGCHLSRLVTGLCGFMIWVIEDSKYTYYVKRPCKLQSFPRWIEEHSENESLVFLGSKVRSMAGLEDFVAALFRV